MNHVPSAALSIASSGASPASSAHRRASACPALTRIVAARDGGLCRIRLPGGVLHAHEAAAIAEAATLHASGVIELTNRANLQLRGVRAGHEATLTARLLQAGLGPQMPADTPHTIEAIDGIRNLMISPLAGHDPQALCDTRTLAAQILALLQSEPRFAALSPKFALLLDGGEQLMAIDHPHDIWLAVMPADYDEPRFAIGFAGCPSLEAGSALAAVAQADVPALLDALLHTFIDLAGADDTRMRDLLVAHDAHVLLQRSADRAGIALQRGAQIDAWHRAPVDPMLRLGAHPQLDPQRWYAGGQPLAGRIDAATLRELGALSARHGDGSLRVTPWQSVLLPNLTANSVEAALSGLHALGFACDPAHPYAAIVACAGSTGCAKSAADTKADAQRLAALLTHDTAVHFTGCTRSCAAAHCAPHTLLAVAAGRYDLYQLTDTFSEGRFGVRIARHLTIEQAAAQLNRPARNPPDA
ncbi:MULTISPECIES: precorrin-3B synthase [Paraburkholderia]|uniref:precorrin-3B synthase n=1 Tax=Paraburkholderia sp. CHISQ3 TaxID=2937435 RepID=UPI0022510517|nr:MULTISPECIES: precorrin-3B synthase [Paraburkholderia]MCX4166061.1 precorrin-3B synthase [Paraburkholderia megapolitana]MDN7161551.1 precorrin-3B synthase [Paraburkholderia sp. CHISQ3]MDQ6498599.1 precorrin-3B synthase [Paraburkholderia megapolitana]